MKKTHKNILDLLSYDHKAIFQPMTDECALISKPSVVDSLSSDMFDLLFLLDNIIYASSYDKDYENI